MTADGLPGIRCTESESDLEEGVWEFVIVIASVCVCTLLKESSSRMCALLSRVDNYDDDDARSRGPDVTGCFHSFETMIGR